MDMLLWCVSLLCHEVALSGALNNRTYKEEKATGKDPERGWGRQHGLYT